MSRELFSSSQKLHLHRLEPSLFVFLELTVFGAGLFEPLEHLVVLRLEVLNLIELQVE